MKQPRKGLYYKLSDFIIIAMMAGMGLAIKQVIGPLVQIITSSLYIPGGVLAGGIYMLFLVLASAITNKYGAAFLVSAVQAGIVTVTGIYGSQGVASMITYTLPGIAVELLFLITRHKADTPAPSALLPASSQTWSEVTPSISSSLTFRSSR